MPDTINQGHRPAPRPEDSRPPWIIRLSRIAIRLLGWQIRGKLPPQFWRTTLVIWADRPWQIKALIWIMPVKVMMLKGPSEDWQARADQSHSHFGLGRTSATRTIASHNELAGIQRAAHSCKSRITLCAWESRRRFLHVHAPFKTSEFADRDIHYMERYFKYFRNRLKERP